MTRLLLTSLLSGALLWAAAPVWAADPEPAPPGVSAQTVVTHLHETLLEVMQNATSLGYAGRLERLSPVIDDAYDLQRVARVTVGRHWRGWSAARQQQYLALFRRLILATYAYRFNGYSGEHFEVGEVIATERGDRRVQALLVRPNDPPVRFDYLLRERGNGWRIINVVTDGVSDLALKRAEYNAILKRDGFDSLIATLEAQIARYSSDTPE